MTRSLTLEGFHCRFTHEAARIPAHSCREDKPLWQAGAAPRRPRRRSRRESSGGGGSPKTDGKPSDYIWCAGFALAMYSGGKAVGWSTSTPDEGAAFLETLNALGFAIDADQPATWAPVFGV